MQVTSFEFDQEDEEYIEFEFDKEQKQVNYEFNKDQKQFNFEFEDTGLSINFEETSLNNIWENDKSTNGERHVVLLQSNLPEPEPETKTFKDQLIDYFQEYQPTSTTNDHHLPDFLDHYLITKQAKVLDTSNYSILEQTQEGEKLIRLLRDFFILLDNDQHCLLYLPTIEHACFLYSSRLNGFVNNLDLGKVILE
jgi:hypothetical protein